jgi:hypothetical protein
MCSTETLLSVYVCEIAGGFLKGTVRIHGRERERGTVSGACGIDDMFFTYPMLCPLKDISSE